MFTFASQPSASPDAAFTRSPVVAIVGAGAAECVDWLSFAASRTATVESYHTPEEALRRAQSGGVDLWVIDMELPRIPGVDLCRMLGRRRSATCLTTESYSTEVEQQAWQARPTLFANRRSLAAHVAAWIEHWQARRDCVDADHTACKSSDPLLIPHR